MFINIRFFRFMFNDEDVYTEEGTNFMTNATSVMVVLKNRSPVGSSSSEVAAEFANAVGASDSAAASADDTKFAAPVSPELATEAGSTDTYLADGSWVCKVCSVRNPKPMGKMKTQEMM